MPRAPWPRPCTGALQRRGLAQTGDYLGQRPADAATEAVRRAVQRERGRFASPGEELPADGYGYRFRGDVIGVVASRRVLARLLLTHGCEVDPQVALASWRREGRLASEHGRLTGRRRVLDPSTGSMRPRRLYLVWIGSDRPAGK